MNRLEELERRFKTGFIDKDTYTKEMYDLHKILYDYRDFIRNKNIDSIKITSEHVFLKTKDQIKMICDGEDERITPLDILNFGDYEIDEIKMMKRFLKKDSIIIDIGANVGWYCLNLARYVPDGRILAFEPIPKTYKYLEDNISLNGIKNVKLYNFGFSDRKTKSLFYYNPKYSGSASLKKLHKNKKSIKIKCVLNTLDSCINRIADKVDLIKCDVEGAELFVIKGGIKTIKKNLPVIFIEMLRKWSAKYGYHPNEIIELLHGLGYGCYYINNNKLPEINKITKKTVPTNFCFMHIDKHKSFLKKI